MTYSVNKENIKGEFSVPNIIADKHLRLASGEQIKVLLYILRKSNKHFTAEEVAKFLKYNVSDVEDYLQYWVLTGVLNENEQAQAKPEMAEPVKYVPKASPKKEDAPAPKAEAKPEIEYTRPTPAEIATRISESREIANLFGELQKKLGKTIGYDGQCTFLLLHDRFGLSPEVIFMLVEYCVSIGKTGYSYIEAVGKGWAEREIDTIEKAAGKIAALNSVQTFWNKFIVETGISTPRPTQKQIPYIEKWINELNMSYEMIMKAYEETADHTGKLSFSYMNKIIENWHQKGYKTTADIETAEAARKDAKVAISSGASYDLDDITRKTNTKKIVYERKNR